LLLPGDECQPREARADSADPLFDGSHTRLASLQPSHARRVRGDLRELPDV
jgi:hypothetical protein